MNEADRVEKFLEKFQLSSDQKTSLYEKPISTEFFEALSSVAKIRQQCTLMIGTSNQSAGYVVALACCSTNVSKTTTQVVDSPTFMF